MSIPAEQKALVLDNGKGVVKTVPVPEIGADDVLVKTVSVAINPTDWKHTRFNLGSQGSIIGCDFAGTVAAVGSKVTTLKVGETVAGFVAGADNFTPENGAFAEYVRCKPQFVFHVELKKAQSTELPIGPIDSFEGIVSLSIPILTVALGVDFFSKIPFFGKKNPEYANKVFFIWGGATSLGYVAIQTAKRLGFKVVTTASKKHTETLKGLGADAVFDYRDEDVLDQVKAFGKDDIVFGFDCISENGTTEKILEVVSKSKPVDICLVLPNVPEISLPENVKIHRVLSYLAVSPKKQFADGPITESPAGMQEFGAKFCAEFSDAITKDKNFILHQPVKVQSGLDSLESGFSILEQGKNSGYKVVVDL